jgi:hypothetical protein
MDLIRVAIEMKLTWAIENQHHISLLNNKINENDHSSHSTWVRWAPTVTGVTTVGVVLIGATVIG